MYIDACRCIDFIIYIAKEIKMLILDNNNPHDIPMKAASPRLHEL